MDPKSNTTSSEGARGESRALPGEEIAGEAIEALGSSWVQEGFGRGEILYLPAGLQRITPAKGPKSVAVLVERETAATMEAHRKAVEAEMTLGDVLAELQKRGRFSCEIHERGWPDPILDESGWTLWVFAGPSMPPADVK